MLDRAPSLYLPPGSAGGGAPALGARGRGRERPAPGAPTQFTDEDGNVLHTDDGEPVDPEVLARVHQIAARLALPRPRPVRRARRGPGALVSRRFTGVGDELDLDASLEQLAGNPVPDDDDLVVRERAGTRRSVVLVVDASGSMRGERIRTAAATVGAVAGELARDDVGVVAFWSDAVVLQALGARLDLERLLADLLRLPARGLTNVSHPLAVAASQLARVPRHDARVVLLSDCVHNAGPDPRTAAARLPRLDVLFDATGECDEQLGLDLARAGRGRLVRVTGHRGVAPALRTIFEQ
ncbi:VWA domain-containing protein [uncultured Jatrophihabitans sp.]|uniref:vWA domain-containing protein n=1 Tax=uncultured Jatrophihabitans sp. TaxID=1610747 RepID=UPI0035CBBD9E